MLSDVFAPSPDGVSYTANISVEHLFALLNGAFIREILLTVPAADASKNACRALYHDRQRSSKVFYLDCERNELLAGIVPIT